MRQLHMTKGENKRLNLLTAIEQVVELSENSGLENEFFEKAKRYVSYISKKLSLTPVQSVLFSIFINKSDDQHIRISEFASHFKCRTVRIIRYMSDIDVLEQRKLVRCCRENKSQSYRVPIQVIEAMKQDKAYQPQDYSNLECNGLFGVLNDLFEQRKEDEMTYEMLVSEIEVLFESNMHLEFVRKIKQYKLDNDDRMLLILFCHLFVNNNDDNIGYYDFDDLYSTNSTYRSQKNSLIEGWNILLGEKLLEHVNNGGFADNETFKLTERAKKELLSELNIISKQTCSDKGLLLHKDLVQKQLYYNEREQKQIGQLSALLNPSRFIEIQKRLSENGMRKGFACLFYGAPGTGKTETVFQLAKQSGRNIMQVNISEIKSMWVGESEKNIKALFDRYRAYVENSEVAPILLFNEADAIIGKRRKGAERSVDKMENSIQNIILQEMESLDGILIATTNLTQNMDKAFERRFLYKVEFEKPNLDAKRAIWKAMIPALNEKDATELASNYEFSGGQIENIARKHTVESILTGSESMNIDMLKQFCKDELIAKQETQRKIGFQ